MPRKTVRAATLGRDRNVDFNEAAARCRGKPARGSPAPPNAASFNEAAARCRGKPPHAQRVAEAAGEPSMRPRPDAAENRQSAVRRGRTQILLQ